ncbi:aldehyde dehydrogenase family protein [Streptomyces sp. NBC_00258]|uniref:aldehyde dehydrogenase family protein n=1 Tax=Streptomyces sp. NBC_00258 TaxID=2903642 RepID=UPI002E28CEFC|nr:aldehyde dehydrogenase family protein [Streptomyces sp. NBC_00258]
MINDEILAAFESEAIEPGVQLDGLGNTLSFVQTTPAAEIGPSVTADVWRGHWIGGHRVDSASRIPVTSPIGGEDLGDIASGSAEEVDAAVAAARSAFPAWAALGPQGRREHLRAFADAIARHGEKLAQVETLDNGTLLAAMRNRFVPRAKHNIEFFADRAVDLNRTPIVSGEVSHHTRYQPAGVAALITPWNAPLMLTTWKLGPALAAGNTVVIKPPELAPLSCSLLAEIAAEAGIPDGVINVVQGYGREAGAALVEHPDIDRLSFTGSVPTGRVAARAAERMVPVSLELGGKSPLIVFEDADIDLAVADLTHQYHNAGQVCLAGTRVIVHEAIADVFLERAAQATAELRVGDPRQPSTQVGPLISDQQARRVAGFVERALDDGAELLWGSPERNGLYMMPMLLASVRQDMEVVQEEIFGPVLTFQTFADEAEAVALANGTRFALAAGVYTTDAQRAWRVSDAIVSGLVWVNGYGARHLATPFGGTKSSGLGREGGDWSFDFFCDVKNVSITADTFGGTR